MQIDSPKDTFTKTNIREDIFPHNIDQIERFPWNLVSNRIWNRLAMFPPNLLKIHFAEIIWILDIKSSFFLSCWHWAANRAAMICVEMRLAHVIMQIATTLRNSGKISKLFFSAVAECGRTWRFWKKWIKDTRICIFNLCKWCTLDVPDRLGFPETARQKQKHLDLLTFWFISKF